MDTPTPQPQRESQPAIPTSTETNVPIVCPHCHRGFWAKFGHVLKEIVIAGAEIAAATETMK